MERFIHCLKAEMALQKDYLAGQQVSTIYFGGGTPSLLSASQLHEILSELSHTFNISDNPEITIEANPDDFNAMMLNELLAAGVNRLSIGIQSFLDDELQFLNRRHSAMQAINAVKDAQKAGFDNISVDLIYGIPHSTAETFQHSLDEVKSLNVQHLSAYHLIYEKGTPLFKKMKQGKVIQVSDSISVEQYRQLTTWAKANSFQHYEISNFCLPGYESRHNSSYWQQKPYLGLGPSAHSYNIRTRQWNIRSLNRYIEAIENGEIPSENEVLSETDRFNEYLMTTLRTQWGASLDYLSGTFGKQAVETLLSNVSKYPGKTALKNNNLRIRPEFWFVSDSILSELFI